MRKSRFSDQQIALCLQQVDSSDCPFLLVQLYSRGSIHGREGRRGVGGPVAAAGQKQRLSIARALVREAPVLVLDEPTAALDPETEFRLVAALREVSRDTLVIVIAHRLSTIRHADQILFLHEGQIRERGTHAELLEVETASTAVWSSYSAPIRRPRDSAPRAAAANRNGV